MASRLRTIETWALSSSNYTDLVQKLVSWSDVTISDVEHHTIRFKLGEHLQVLLDRDIESGWIILPDGASCVHFYAADYAPTCAIVGV